MLLYRHPFSVAKAWARLGFFALVFLLLADAPLAAQPAPSARRVEQGEKPSKAVQTLGEGRLLLEKGDIESAETKLASANPFPAQTAQWHLENATNLLRLAFSAQEKGDAENARKAAWRALAQTNLAARLAADNDPALLARIATLRATLSENFLGTTTSAESQRRVAEDQEREAKKDPERRRKKTSSEEKDQEGKPRDKNRKPKTPADDAEPKRDRNKSAS